MKYAILREKKGWKNSIYGEHRTKMLIFETDDGSKLILNIRTDKPSSLEFDKLKKGDKICDFRTLLNKDKNIDPNSTYRVFGTPKPLF